MRTINTQHYLSLILLTLGFIVGGVSGGFNVVWAGDEDHQRAIIRNSEASGKNPGRWNVLPASDEERVLTPEEENQLSLLMALPYAQGTQRASVKKNVTLFDSKLACDGLNLYVSGHGPEAFLIDMEGNILHAWHYNINNIWPDAIRHVNSGYWIRAYLLPQGDLLAMYDGIGMIKLDKNSNLLWSFRGAIHHDMAIDENDQIYTLKRRPRRIPAVNPDTMALDEYIIILNSNGAFVKEYSITDCFLNSPYRYYTDRMKKLIGHNKRDYLHANSIQIFDGKHAGISEIFKKGNALISMRVTHSLAIIDLDKGSVVWAADGREERFGWKMQHRPILLENGNIILFDNLGPGEKMSRVLEIDPMKNEILWQYGHRKGEEFFSETCGAAYRLLNGNTLIVASDSGKAFEINPQRKIVWEFYNPHLAGENNELVATLMDLVRIQKSSAPWALGREEAGN